MDQDLSKRIDELIQLFNEECPKVKQISVKKDISLEDKKELFLTSVENLTDQEIDSMSQKIFDSYEELAFPKESGQFQPDSSQSIINKGTRMSEITIATMTEEDKIKFLLGIFDFWKKKGIVKEVVLPEELTLSAAEKAFVLAVEQMSWADKMTNGGYTQEIDSYYMFVKTKPVKERKARTKVDRAKLAAEQLDQLAFANTEFCTITGLNLPAVVDLPQGQSALLENVFALDFEKFQSLIASTSFTKYLFELLKVRNVHKTKAPRVRTARSVKKWDGQGEPFQENAPSGDRSLTFAIWEKIKKNKTSFDQLDAWLNKEFPRSNGKARKTSNYLVKMQARVSDFFTVTIPEKKDEKITVTKVG